jgi:hypothetical protein
MFGSESGIRDEKMIGSGIKHPGSATLLASNWAAILYLIRITYRQVFFSDLLLSCLGPTSSGDRLPYSRRVHRSGANPPSCWMEWAVRGRAMALVAGLQIVPRSETNSHPINALSQGAP